MTDKESSDQVQRISVPTPMSLLEEFDERADELDVPRANLIRGLMYEFVNNFPSLKARGFFLGVKRPLVGEHLNNEEFKAQIKKLESELEDLKSAVGEKEE